MSQQAYSDLKPAWHTAKMEEIRLGRQIVPPHVQLIISDLCNHDCHFCAYRMSNGFSSEQFGEDTGKGFTMNPNRRIPYDKALEILHDCAQLGVKAIQFTGGGEPTVHPQHLALFAAAQALGMQTSLVTNGATLKPGWQDTFSRMAWIRISLDAGRPETYGFVRNVNPRVFNKVLDHVSMIVMSLKEAKSDCLLGVGYVVTPENYLEIYSGCSHIKETGAAYVRLAAMFSKEGSKPYKDIYPSIKTSIEQARKEFEDDDFKIVDLFGDRIHDLDQGSPDYKFCGYQQFNMYIGGNLKVYRCCTTAYTQRGDVGDLSDKTLFEWFHSQEKRKAYETFNAKRCEVCQFNDKNRTINYMLQPEPMHVNFV